MRHEHQTARPRVRLPVHRLFASERRASADRQRHDDHVTAQQQPNNGGQVSHDVGFDGDRVDMAVYVYLCTIMSEHVYVTAYSRHERRTM
jgi:hypothetical protein